MTFSPFLDDVEMEVLAQDMSSGLEPLTVKKFFFADENVYVSHASGKNVTTRGEMGVKYKKISNCSMTRLIFLPTFRSHRRITTSNIVSLLPSGHLDVALSGSRVPRGDMSVEDSPE